MYGHGRPNKTAVNRAYWRRCRKGDGFIGGSEDRSDGIGVNKSVQMRAKQVEKGSESETL